MLVAVCCVFLICVQEYGRVLPQVVTAQDGYARAVQGVHFGQILYGAAEVLGDGEEVARCVSVRMCAWIAVSGFGRGLDGVARRLHLPL